ncbi:MAG: AAA family ATPase [Pyrinomonadaceae bacterium]
MIRLLRLSNFKCFKNQQLDLAPLTLLSGLNGTGKSSVLQSLLLLRQSYYQGLLQNRGLALNGDLVRIGMARDALYEGAEEERITFNVAWVGGNEAQWIFNYNRAADVLDIVSPQASAEVFEESLFGDDFQYLQAERIGPRTAFETSDNLVRQHKQLGTRGQYTAHFLSMFERDEIPHKELAHSEVDSLKLRDQVEAWMGEVSPGTRLHINTHAGLDLVSLEYSFVSGSHTSNNYRSTNVGFGITYTLPIIVAILSARSDALLMIENPEAHLHPKGQVRMGHLISLAAQCGVQILVETHSDHVLNGIRLAVHEGQLPPEKVQLYFFDRPMTAEPAHKVVSPAINRDGRIDRWPNNFFDEWDKSLEVLLQPTGE